MTEATYQRKKRLYLAGPMRCIKWFNFPAFDSHRDHLNALGWDVVSPADIDRACGFDPVTLPTDYDWGSVPEAAGTLDEIMLRDIEALETCDAIYMMRGWEDSSGANRELSEARKLGLREFYEDVCASPDPKVMQGEQFIDQWHRAWYNGIKEIANENLERACKNIQASRTSDVDQSPDVMKTGAIYDKWATEIRENTARATEQMREHIDDILRGAVPNREIVDMQTGETRTVDSSGERVFEDDGIGKCVRHLYDIAQQFDTPCGIPEPMGETRITDALTGGQKGAKAERYDLLPVEPMAELARHYGVGAKKYADHNYRKGYKWSLSYAALQRHLNAFWRGEDIDSETGSKHVIAAAFHCLALAEYMDTRRSHDDRYVREVNA